MGGISLDNGQKCEREGTKSQRQTRRKKPMCPRIPANQTRIRCRSAVPPLFEIPDYSRGLADPHLRVCLRDIAPSRSYLIPPNESRAAENDDGGSKSSRSWSRAVLSPVQCGFLIVCSQVEVCGAGTGSGSDRAAQRAISPRRTAEMVMPSCRSAETIASPLSSTFQTGRFARRIQT